MDTRAMTMEYRLHYWSGIIKECSESGLSIKTYCKNAGFHENRYYYWKKKLREKACNELVNIQKETVGMIPSGFSEVKISQPYTLPFPVTDVENQISIEVSGIRFIAGGGYPLDKLTRLIQEMRLPC